MFLDESLTYRAEKVVRVQVVRCHLDAGPFVLVQQVAPTHGTYNVSVLEAV